jgi:hypothetical protein
VIIIANWALSFIYNNINIYTKYFILIKYINFFIFILINEFDLFSCRKNLFSLESKVFFLDKVFL